MVKITTFQTASVVVGQPTFTTGSANQGGSAGPKTVNMPFGNPTVSYGRLYLPDYFNHRVLGFNTVPASSNAPADVVLGQNDFVHSQKNDDNQDGAPDAAPSARTFDYPYSLASDGTRLFMADSDNSRVLVWNSMPNLNFAPADAVLGQGDFTHFMENDDNQDGSVDGPTARTFSYPSGLYIAGNRLFVADNGNHRYLIFDYQ